MTGVRNDYKLKMFVNVSNSMFVSNEIIKTVGGKDISRKLYI